jgi:hypothetical protein
VGASAVTEQDRADEARWNEFELSPRIRTFPYFRGWLCSSCRSTNSPRLDDEHPQPALRDADRARQPESPSRWCAEAHRTLKDSQSPGLRAPGLGAASTRDLAGPQPERPAREIHPSHGNAREDAVREHLRRIRCRHPELYAELMAKRAKRLERWHADVARRRLERSRRWGKARWASRYRGQHGVWPGAALERTGKL